MSEETRNNQLLDRLGDLLKRAEQDCLQPDAELLAMYVEGGSREAIEKLIRRYSTMVATVCRLTVADPTHAEDAFQATFLILLQSAAKIRKRGSIASWLHGVAYRTASRIRSKHRSAPASKQSSVEDVITARDSELDPAVELARKMELEALDREMENLPERLRAPLIEHYLLGYSAPQIAARMDLSLSAVEGRLKRGRRKLRSLLARRGISLSIMVASSAFFQEHLAASEAHVWTDKFVDAHLPDWESSGGTSAPPVSPEVSSLVHGELTMFSSGMIKATFAAGLMLTATTLAVLAANPNHYSDGPAERPQNALQVDEIKQSGEAAIQLATSNAGKKNAGRTENQLAPSSQKSSPPNNQASAALGQFGNTAGAGGGAPPMPTSQASGDDSKREPVEWRMPDGVEPPAWLRSSDSVFAQVEQNRQAVSQEIEFNYNEMPLYQLTSALQNETGVQFEINTAELDLLGIDKDTPVTAVGRGSVRELFRRVLEPLELTYRINPSTIEITSIDHAESKPMIRYYDLSFVLPNDAQQPSLQTAIEQTIEPDSWVTAGGTCSISFVGSMCIIAAPEPTHEQIEQLLVNISKVNPNNLEAPSNAKGGYGVGFGGGMGGMGGGAMGGGGMF